MMFTVLRTSFLQRKETCDMDVCIERYKKTVIESLRMCYR